MQRRANKAAAGKRKLLQTHREQRYIMPPIGKERRDCARKEAEKKLEHRETKGKGSINGASALERRLHSP
jgi:hypothetical protein